MKISLELDVVVAFIRELSDVFVTQTQHGQAFLLAIADSVQDAASMPETRSKKRKPDPVKQGDGVYVDQEAGSSPPKTKKVKTDCQNAMAKEAAALPRRVDLNSMPKQGIRAKLRSAGPSMTRTVVQNKDMSAKKTKAQIGEGKRDLSDESTVEEAMLMLKEWEWPIMGRKPMWATDGKPPALSLLASRFIVTLSTIKQVDHSKKLAQLIDDLYSLEQGNDITNRHGPEVQSLAGINAILDNLEEAKAVQDFLQLWALMHLVLVRKSEKKAGRKLTSMEGIAKVHGIEYNTLKWRYKAGTQVTYLAAAGLWVLPMIAVLQLKARLLYHSSDGREVRGTTCADISGLAFVLRYPCENDIAQLVDEISKVSKQLTQQCSGRENKYLQIHLADRAINFSDLSATDAFLDEVYISYFRLLARQEKAWASLIHPEAQPVPYPLTSTSAGIRKCANQMLNLTIHMKLQLTPNPVNTGNRESWTTRECERASKAEVLTGHERSYNNQASQFHQATLVNFYAGERKLKDRYLLVDSSQLHSNTVCINDKSGQVVGTLIRNVIKNIPNVNDIIPQIQAIIPGALEYDDSRRPEYKYSAFHGQIYNRFSEKGTDAPKNIHPHRLHRKGKKGNPNQRLPHYGKQVNKDPDRFELLCNILKLLMGFIRESLKQILPEEYNKLEDFADNLMMNEDSAAHPLSGFVLNFRACTSAHRDTGDLLICVVIPFSEFEGGELCLFEPGLVLRLRAWDAFIFCSVEVTHFNLHYSGVRGSFVLHTDHEAADYTKDYNGWVEHVANK